MTKINNSTRTKISAAIQNEDIVSSDISTTPKIQ